MLTKLPTQLYVYDIDGERHLSCNAQQITARYLLDRCAVGEATDHVTVSFNTCLNERRELHGMNIARLVRSVICVFVSYTSHV